MMDEYSFKEGSLFPQLFASRFSSMPQAWQKFHTVSGEHCYEGEAEVIRGESLLLRILASVLRLPPTSKVPVKLVIKKEEDFERWSRFFGDSFFSTVLFSDEKKTSGQQYYYLRERFGPLCFGIVLTVEAETVIWRIDRWWFFKMPLPKLFAPKSETKEFIDTHGRYAFDIDLSVPFLGRLIAYRGWLVVD